MPRLPASPPSHSAAQPSILEIETAFLSSHLDLHPSVGTIELRISVAPEHYDAIVAELETSAVGFLTGSDALHAFMPAEAWSDDHTQSLLAWLHERKWEVDINTSFHPDTNWNEKWEATIQPIRAGQFLIRPTWSEPVEDADVPHELIVDPKMSFGTGYHQSTRLVLRLLTEAIEPGDTVLDVGAGTGILSIAACRLGADHCIAVDIDPNAVENAPENARLNECEQQIDVRKGSMDVVSESGFDVILANINRNVLLDLMPQFAEASAPGARLILAGLLKRDKDVITDRANECGYTIDEIRSENEWIGLRLRLQERA